MNLPNRGMNRQAPGGNSSIVFGEEMSPESKRQGQLNRGTSMNTFANGQNQNCGNFITDRPSTRVVAQPGGGSTRAPFATDEDDDRRKSNTRHVGGKSTIVFGDDSRRQERNAPCGERSAEAAGRSQQVTSQDTSDTKESKEIIEVNKSQPTENINSEKINSEKIETIKNEEKTTENPIEEELTKENTEPSNPRGSKRKLESVSDSPVAAGAKKGKCADRFASKDSEGETAAAENNRQPPGGRSQIIFG